VSGSDSSVYDYQAYDPVTNTWEPIGAPSRTGEGSLWNRGGLPFRYSNNEVAVIGRRTYTSNNTAPSNIDRFYGRRLWKYNIDTQIWVDISTDLGKFYPHVMRPSPSQMNNMRAYQPQSTIWNGRFLMFYGEESGMTTRGNYQYINVKRPRQVRIVGQTGKARGEMSVGSSAVLAFGHLRGYNNTPGSYFSMGVVGYGDRWGSTRRNRTGGWEVVYTDGRVKYGPPGFHPLNVIYDPTNKGWYLSGWKIWRSSEWYRMSYFVNENDGRFEELDDNGYEQSGDRGDLEISSNGLAYTPASHFIRPYDQDNLTLANLSIGGNGSDGQYYGLTDYTWAAAVQPTENVRTRRVINTPSSGPSRAQQVVFWGPGDRNVVGIPEGTVFWDGRTLRQYSYKAQTAPYTTLQTGWRIIFTAPVPDSQTGGCYYGTPHVWRNRKYAICPSSTTDHYYVFDLDNLYTSDPKIIGSHLPIDTAPAPQWNPGASVTISNNSNEYVSNKACIAGVEIIYGHLDYDAVAPLHFNDNIYIVTDPTPSASTTLDQNS
jgi:hypothetical protein